MKYFTATTFKLTSAAILVCATLSANAAQTAADETIVVTASRSAQNIADVQSSVTILTRSDIEASPAQSVAELLGQINGIQVTNNGGAGQNASVFIRGTNTGHALVVVDGQLISSATLGQTTFANIPKSQIERIEIIKGARASIWGADAIGGVIQIFTRQLTDGEIALDLGAGNGGQQQASLSGALGHGDGVTTITIAASSADGHDVIIDVPSDYEPDKDGYRRENVSIIGHQNLTNNWQINWLAKYDQGNSKYDNGWKSNQINNKASQWQLGASQTNDQWQQRVSIGQQINEDISFGDGTSLADASLFKTKRLQLNWLGSTELSSELSANLGADWYRESIKTNNTYDQTERDVSAVFGHMIYNNSNLILEGSLRYDDIESVGNEVTYNASAGIHLNDGSLLSFNIGHGFKAPSFNQLYYPNYGNPDLKPETSDSVEWLLRTKLGLVNTELSIYRTNIENLISRYNDSQPVKIKGVELVLDGSALGFEHQVQLGYLNAKDTATDKPLALRAKHTASYLISYDWQQLQFSSSINYQGKRIDGSQKLASNTLVNFSASYQIDNFWKVAVKANNVFDKQYISAYYFGSSSYYAGEPARVLLTLSYRQ